MKILLTGARGQLGRCLQDRYPDQAHLLMPDRQELDMSQPASIAEYVRQAQPDWIINAAAYTAVDRAETEPDVALAVNATAPAELARVARKIGARMVHVSTDYVFDGSSVQPYGEADPTCPLNVYGATKLQGEKAVLDAMPAACVIRTSWVYSEYGNNFLKTMLRVAERYQAQDQAPSTPIRVVDDQIGCPTYAGDLADAILAIHGMSQPVSGLYHYSGSTVLSWFDFAKRIFDCKHSTDAGFVMPPLEPIPTSEYPTPAARPASSVLSCEKIAALGIAPRGLDEALAKVIGRL
ncbi:dTDP-4-dehydrorhamnose reductase [Alcaligenaceae bacterium]|nr:dTDP-4-dehydrorhamnose reductase [Alcaligenaceae bacterium]